MRDQQAGVARVAHDRVRPAGDELVVFLDASLEAEKFAEVAEGDDADERADNHHQPAGERRGREAQVRGVAPRKEERAKNDFR